MGEINHKRGPKFKTEDEKKKKRIMVRLDEFTFAKLSERVEVEGVSVSDYVRVAIEDALDRDADRERYRYNGY